MSKKDNSFGSDKKITRRRFLGGAIGAGVGAAFLGGAGKALASMAPRANGVKAIVPMLTLRTPGSLKILQITDTHMNYLARGFLAEPQKMDSIKAMVKHFDPDIIVNTGDFWANVSGAAGVDTCRSLCKEFEKFKTPWAFAWGNHDESTDYNLAHETLEKAQYSLYRGAAADGNYRIEVRADGKASPVWNLIMLNNSRSGFKKEQIDWFNDEVKRIKQKPSIPPPAFLFFHIPLPQYNDIALPGKAVGVKFENVCDEGAGRDALPAFQQAGFVKAMFCGHDHVNDYHGDIKGIRLQYGRALGGYGKEKVRKGGTLITVDTNKQTLETKSVFPDGSSVTYDKLILAPETDRIY